DHLRTGARSSTPSQTLRGGRPLWRSGYGLSQWRVWPADCRRPVAIPATTSLPLPRPGRALPAGHTRWRRGAVPRTPPDRPRYGNTFAVQPLWLCIRPHPSQAPCAQPTKCGPRGLRRLLGIEAVDAQGGLHNVKERLGAELRGDMPGFRFSQAVSASSGVIRKTATVKILGVIV